MDKSRSDQAALDLFRDLMPAEEACSLPMPRFSKTPMSALQSLPENGDSPFSLSWADEQELGIRVVVTAEQGPRGTEIITSAEGVRPDLLGHAVSVTLSLENHKGFKRLTVPLDQLPADRRGCTGRKSFGRVDDLRQRLGDKVCVDAFLVVYRDRPAPA
jgi:hypothetical protein